MNKITFIGNTFLIIFLLLLCISCSDKQILTEDLGNYICEQKFSFPQLASVKSLTQDENGDLHALVINKDRTFDFMQSTDDGKSWAANTPDWLKGISQKMIGALIHTQENGYLYLCWDFLSGSKNAYGDTCYLVYVDPSGLQSDAIALGKIKYNDNMQLFQTASGDILLSDINTDSVHQYDKAGNVIFTYGSGSQFAYSNDKLYVANSENISIYDTLTTELVKEIETSENPNITQYISISSDGGILYLLDKTGISFVNVDTGEIEQVMDGKRSSLDDPSLTLTSMATMEDKNIYALFVNTNQLTYELSKFTYQDKSPDRPTGQLNIYSIDECKTIKQAVVSFARENTNVAVNYVPITQNWDAALNTSDYIRVLNTELLAGKGPDIIIMDELPLQSYVERGVLLDLTPLLNQIDGGVLKNITAYQPQEDAIYAIPARFEIPVLLGRKEMVDRAGDLESLSQLIQNIRTDKKSINDSDGGDDEDDEDVADGGIGCDYYGKIITQLLPVCYPLWEETNDRSAVEEFLLRVKELSLPEARRDYGKFDVAGTSRAWANDHIDLAMGSLNSWLDIAYANGAIYHKNEGIMVPMTGQVSGVYIPTQIIAINKNSEQPDLAASFFKTALSTEIQSTFLRDGFPVNEAALQAGRSNPPYPIPDLIPSLLSTKKSEKDDEPIYAEWPTETELDGYINMMRSLKTPCAKDQDYYKVLELIFTEGENYFTNNASLESAITSIYEKMLLMDAE